MKTQNQTKMKYPKSIELRTRDENSPSYFQFRTSKNMYELRTENRDPFQDLGFTARLIGETSDTFIFETFDLTGKCYTYRIEKTLWKAKY